MNVNLANALAVGSIMLGLGGGYAAFAERISIIEIKTERIDVEQQRRGHRFADVESNQKVILHRLDRIEAVLERIDAHLRSGK